MSNPEKLLGKQLFMLTVEEWLEVNKMVNRESTMDDEPKISLANSGKGEKVFGIKGIAEELGISHTTAQRHVSSGKLDAAITRVGSVIVADKEALWAVFRNNQRLKYAHQYPKRA